MDTTTLLDQYDLSHAGWHRLAGALGYRLVPDELPGQLDDMPVDQELPERWDGME